ncbi:MAG: xanthine dehydrogenase family protein molybdopterin-binding subunit [Carbonactinosporaceae bacterium]
MSADHTSLDREPPHSRQSIRYVGSPCRRLEDARALTGQASFVDDVVLSGMLHACFVRSPYAHARVTSIDVSAALQVRGVVAAFTGQDFAGRCRPWRGLLDWPGMKAGYQYPLSPDKVHFVGEPVAIVLARDRYCAEDGAEAVDVEYDPLPPVVDPDEAMKPGSPLVHDDLGDNVLFSMEFRHGDVGDAFDRASHVVSRSFTTGRHTALSLEARGIVAKYESSTQSLTTWVSTQAAHMLQATYASILGLAENRVRVITGDVGGSFGMKAHVYPDEVAVCAAAITLGRPVKWIQDRVESLQTDTHARDERFTVHLALDREGTILGLKTSVVSDAGAYSVYPRSAVTEGYQVASVMPGPYRITNYAFDLRIAMTNKSPLAVYRAVGHPGAILGMEAMIEAAAREMGIDPIDLRRRNLISEGELPYESATGYVYDSGSYQRALERIVDQARLDESRQEQAALRAEGRYIGIGTSCFVELTAPGSQFYGKKGAPIAAYDEAEIRVEADGKVVLLLGTPGQGQGLRTTAAQVVADELGVRLEDIEVLDGDTKLLPYGTDTWASRTAVVSAGAAAVAARDLRERIKVIASHLLEADPHDIELADSTATVRGVPGQGVSMTEIASIAHYHGWRLPKEVERGLHVVRSYEGPAATFNNGIHVAVVDVDPALGTVSLLRYEVVEDVGRLINPAIVDGQIRGGIGQGVGEALLEHVIYNADGQPVTATLMDYLLPGAMEVPSMRISHIETPAPHTLLGTKGVGEAGLAGAPAAIFNAVNDALTPFGAEVCDLPITPEAVRQAIRGHESREA